MDDLGDEAAHLLWVLEVGCSSDETTGDVTKVDSGEGVDGTGVSTNLAVGWVGETLLRSRDQDVAQGPGVVVGAAVPVIWDTLMAVGEDELVVGISGVGEERLEDLWCQEAARILSRVVGEELVSEHVSTKGKGNTGVGGREVVGIGGDGVLLAIVLVLCQDSWRDISTSASLCKVEQLLANSG